MKLRIQLLLITGLLAAITPIPAQTWTQTGLPNSQWRCFASSADGTTLVAEPGYSYQNAIFVSTNGGLAWKTNNAPTFIMPGFGPFPISFISIASSADGTKLAGASVGGIICTSTNSGTTWTTNNAPSAAWYSMTSSSDGTKLAVAAGGGGNSAGPIYISTNSGAIWLPTSAPSNSWRSIASSADGTKLLAGTEFSAIPYVSTNSGTTWIPTTLPTTKQWGAVACSADGKKMAAAYTADGSFIPGHMFTSVDSGTTWESNRLATGFWEAIAMSSDGNKIVLVSEDSVVFTSTNFGVNWESNTITGSSDFVYYNSLASSADCGKLITGSIFNQTAFVSQSVYPPQLNLTPANTNLAVSWFIPSINIVLQQSSDLTTWADVTNVPVLNLTNLQNQVTLPSSNASGFYRLKTP